MTSKYNYMYEKSRAHSSQCCGLALSHGLVLYIGLTSLHLSKKNCYDFIGYDYDYDSV